MTIKIFCDWCKKQIIGNEGGMFSIVTKEYSLSAKANPVPQFQKQEFQLCKKCSEEILEIIKKVEPK